MIKYLKEGTTPLNKKIKIYGLVLLMLFLLVSTAQASESDGVQYELVANTICDENGYYVFNNIPDGNYTLVATNYSDDRNIWYTASLNITVQDTDLVDRNLRINSSNNIDPYWVQDLLNNSSATVDSVAGFSVSGISYVRSLDYPRMSAVILLKSTSDDGFVNLTYISDSSDSDSSDQNETESQDSEENQDSTSGSFFKFFGNTTSDENGEFLFSGIPDGDYRLSAVIYSSSMGGMWLTNESEFSIEDGQPVNLTFTMRSNESIDDEEILGYLDRTTISGLTLSKSGDIKAGTDLVLTTQDEEFVANTTSDANGEYLFSDVPNGDYRLSAVIYSSSMGGMWLTNESEFSIEDGQPVNLTFAMRSNESIDDEEILGYLDRTTISGQTLSKSGDIKAGTDLVLTTQDEEFVANTTSDDNGEYLFSDVPNGDYRLSAVIYSSSMGGMWLTNESEFSIEDGQPVNLTFAMRSNESIDHEEILGYLDRTTVSGLTLSKSGAIKAGTDLVLLKKTSGSSAQDSDSSNSGSTSHLNVAIITGYSNYDLKLNALAERINGNSSLNLSVSYYLPATSGGDVDLSDMDIIYINMFTDSASKLENTVNEAIANGAVVIGYNTYLPDNIDNSSLPSSFSDVGELKTYLQDYWVYGATNDANFDNLIFYLAQTFYGRDDLQVSAPEGAASSIYHPGMVNSSYFTANASEYFEWYGSRNESEHSFDKNAPTVGILFYLSYYPADMQPIDALIEEFESRGVNVIACYGSSKESVDKFLNHNSSTKADLIVSTTYRSQYFDIEALGVPVINCVLNGYMNLSEWQNVSDPLTNTYMIRLYRPETWGWIDPIMIASNELDNETNTEVYVPVEAQVEWLVDRAVAQTDLSGKGESEKKVAVLYYSHGCGNDSIGASYLEVIPSINNLLEGMADAGYDIDKESIPNESELTSLMLKQGTNIGTWAPGELERLVDSGEVGLIPESTYLEWFSALPEERQQEVIGQWGPAPGEIMVYEDDSGDKFLVIPKVEVSDNVILAPQPTRGWLSDNELLYHDGDLPPHHQYLAFYLWLQNEYGADVIVNMGRHGTVEWLPGKEFCLFSDEWPAIISGDIPVIYPYIMDGMGEGMQAKRRGNAVIIDHLVPPVVLSESYGNYTELSSKISQYQTLPSESELKELRMQEIVNLTQELSLDEFVNVSLSESEDTEEEFLDELDDILEELKTTSMPYGLHILGTSPEGENLTQMVYSMLGDDFSEEVAEYNSSENASLDLLDLVLLQNVSIEDAQIQVLGSSSEDVTGYLTTAQEYAEKLGESKNEIQQILKALDGEYIEPNIGGDPILRPDALPSGRNFYAFDEQLSPTKQAWELGKEMANQTIETYQANHEGQYPKKIGLIIWAGESTRNEGVTEAEIFYLLGVKPVWDDDGDEVIDVELINSSELGRPRIDVLVQISGLYRDTFPHKVELIDKAVYLAYNDPDNQYGKDEERPTPEYISYDPEDNTNYVRENTNDLFLVLNESLQNETASMTVALLRVFGPEDGTYGTGLSNVVSASNSSTSEIAELYIDRMSYVYGENVWGESIADIVSQFRVDGSSLENTDIFKDNLGDVEVTVFSRSSNTYGILDNSDAFEYLGGLNLAVSSVSGEYPDSYIMNLQNSGDEEIETLSEYLTREIITRVLNPKSIEGMLGSGFEGVSQLADYVENLWGWEKTNPDLVSDDIWNKVYETYVADSELNAELKATNAYAYQSITARMLETALEGNWDASDEVLRNLATEYAESVVENGVACCHHTCGNPTLNSYVAGLVSVPGFTEAIEQATSSETSQEPSESSSSSSGGSGTGEATVVSKESMSSNQTETNSGESASNQTSQTSDAGYGVDSPEIAPDIRQAADSNYVEGYEMQKESVENAENGDFSFSGADIVGILFVVVAMGGIYLGMRKKKM
ncbi:CobN-like chelatase BtuS for metalloporphyrine salvage [Methanosarcina siciliae HI350]|uniref:CobN-like chelatase BtuS for metalloporphyrine salvage n=1 Tax=Methanosarcina siciliae HI350 TaxID=1434119 RepID=A0A0E3L9W8_9EURY|nr:cobaltochelatase subunit CobN [Methanosarcina siciliae]AKB30996.1 CobN-like chelatase BtuS for metalloporphyrine salvage [Methanosarcina siciliae HI350]